MSVVRTFTANAVASRDDLAVHPGVLANNVRAEKRGIEVQIAKAGLKRSGPWRTSTMWARPDPTGDGWLRCTRRNATARLVRITATGVPR